VCKGRIVLDLRARAELDPFIVAAQHRTEPDTGIGLEAHAADHAGVLGNPVTAVGRQLRRMPSSSKIAIHALATSNIQSARTNFAR